jgi:hypothetical protein
VIALYRYISALLIVLCLVLNIASAQNPDADVIAVNAVDRGAQGWTFSVTVQHPDTGWNDYCNGWNVVTDQGEVLKPSSQDLFTRLLLHPHEHEQPFTRSQSGLHIPDGIKVVTVRAHDIIHGFGGKEIIIDLGTEEGPGYRISRD